MEEIWENVAQTLRENRQTCEIIVGSVAAIGSAWVLKCFLSRKHERDGQLKAMERRQNDRKDKFAGLRDRLAFLLHDGHGDSIKQHWDSIADKSYLDLKSKTNILT